MGFRHHGVRPCSWGWIFTAIEHWNAEFTGEATASWGLRGCMLLYAGAAFCADALGPPSSNSGACPRGLGHAHYGRIYRINAGEHRGDGYLSPAQARQPSRDVTPRRMRQTCYTRHYGEQHPIPELRHHVEELI